MIRMFDEDTILGVSSVVIKTNSINKNNDEKKEALESSGNTEGNFENKEEDTSKRKEEQIDEIDGNTELQDDLKLEGEVIEETYEKPGKKESTEVYEDYIGSLNEQIQFLKGQIDEKNRQLTTKDELILNFQYLLKEDRNKILQLENKIEDKKESFWKRLFNKSEV